MGNLLDPAAIWSDRGGSSLGGWSWRWFGRTMGCQEGDFVALDPVVDAVEPGVAIGVKWGSQAATCGGDCCRSMARCQVWRAQAFWASAAISTMTVWLCSPQAGSRRL